MKKSVPVEVLKIINSLLFDGKVSIVDVQHKNSSTLYHIRDNSKESDFFFKASKGAIGGIVV